MNSVINHAKVSIINEVTNCCFLQAGNTFMEQSEASIAGDFGLDVESSFRLPPASPYDNFLNAPKR